MFDIVIWICITTLQIMQQDTAVRLHNILSKDMQLLQNTARDINTAI